MDRFFSKFMPKKKKRKILFGYKRVHLVRCTGGGLMIETKETKKAENLAVKKSSTKMVRFEAEAADNIEEPERDKELAKLYGKDTLTTKKRNSFQQDLMLATQIEKDYNKVG